MLLMGKSTTSMAIFNRYVSLPEGRSIFEKTGVLGVELCKDVVKNHCAEGGVKHWNKLILLRIPSNMVQNAEWSWVSPVAGFHIS